jgi:putative transposase
LNTQRPPRGAPPRRRGSGAPDRRWTKVVGWATANHLKSDLVLAALDTAVAQRQPSAVIHHSDRGTQYTSVAFGQRCKQAGVQPSIGSVGDAYDNALCESFFASLE